MVERVGWAMVGDEAQMSSPGRLNAFLDRLIDWAAYLAGALLVGIMLFVTVSVLLRYVLNRPIGWSVEVSEYSLVCITFFLAAWVLKKEGHVRVDLVISYLNPRTQALLNMVTSALCTGVCLILTFYAGKVTHELYGGSYFTPTILMIPKFIFIGIITLGMLLLTLEFIRRTLRFAENWQTLSSGS
jgi:C4-dicarboxylate transporter, DctQ subunit